MRATLVKVLIAALIAVAFCIVPRDWLGVAQNNDWHVLPSLSGAPIGDDPELALGALLFRALGGEDPDPEWAATIEASEEFRPVLEDFQAGLRRSTPSYAVRDRLHDGRLSAALLRFLKDQGLERNRAVSLVKRVWDGDARLGNYALRSHPRTTIGGFPIYGNSVWIRQHWETSQGAVAMGHKLLVAMGCELVIWLLVLCAWVALRRGSPKTQPRPARVVGVTLLVLSTFGALAIAVSSQKMPNLPPTVTLIGLGVGVALDARQRGVAAPRPGWAGWRQDLLTFLVLGAISLGAGSYWHWAPFVAFRQQPWESSLLAVLLPVAAIGGLWASIVWAAWGTQPEAARRRLRSVIAAFTLIIMCLLPAFGLTGGAGSRRLFDSPMAGLLWLAVIAILQWVIVGVAPRACDPRWLSSHRLVMLTKGSLLCMVSFAPPAYVKKFAIPVVALAMLSFAVVLADGARRRAVSGPEGIDPQTKLHTAAWCAALADGLLLLSLLVVGCGVYARWLEFAATNAMLQEMGIAW